MDISTGTANPVGLPFGFQAMALASNSQGELFVISGLGILYTIDRETGSVTFIGNTGIGNMMSASFDSDDKLWAINSDGYLYYINTRQEQTQEKPPF